MTACFVKNCDGGDGRANHRIPINRRAVWLRAMGLNPSITNEITKTIRLCNKHFLPHDFSPNFNQRKLLKEKVIPRINFKYSSLGEFLDYLKTRRFRRHFEQVIETNYNILKDISPIHKTKINNCVLPHSNPEAIKEFDEDQPLIELIADFNNQLSENISINNNNQPSPTISKCNHEKSVMPLNSFIPKPPKPLKTLTILQKQPSSDLKVPTHPCLHSSRKDHGNAKPSPKNLTKNKNNSTINSPAKVVRKIQRNRNSTNATPNLKKINKDNSTKITSNSETFVAVIANSTKTKDSNSPIIKSNEFNLLPQGICIMCNQEFDNERGFGQLLTHNSVSIHYFCLLFSSGLDQRGDENEEFLGFKFDDVMKEYRRCIKLKCVYCKKFGASIGCNVKACKKTYHFPCSFLLNALNQFYDSFCSYCPEHRTRFPLFKPVGIEPPVPVSSDPPIDPNVPGTIPPIPLSSVTDSPLSTPSPTPDINNNNNNNRGGLVHFKKKRVRRRNPWQPRSRRKSYALNNKSSSLKYSSSARGGGKNNNNTDDAYDEGVEIQRLESKPNIICLICREEFETNTMQEYQVLRSECCEKAFFHRECIQKQAFHSGYLFQCPNCCDKVTFRQSMLDMGIYIPERDASWELEENAFKELYERPSACSAPYCLCPKGNTTFKDLTIWEKVMCEGCGHVAHHLACANLKLACDSRVWYCNDCAPIYNYRLEFQPPKKTPKNRLFSLTTTTNTTNASSNGESFTNLPSNNSTKSKIKNQSSPNTVVNPIKKRKIKEDSFEESTSSNNNNNLSTPNFHNRNNNRTFNNRLTTQKCSI